MSEEEKVNKPRFITGEVVGQEGMVIPEKKNEKKEEDENEDNSRK